MYVNVLKVRYLLLCVKTFTVQNHLLLFVRVNMSSVKLSGAG